MEHPIQFVSRDVMLSGIRHDPNGTLPRRTGVILCVAGLTYHVGLSRLYVRLARRLAENGFHVLRFDPHGIGDSDGRLSKRKLDDLFRDVEQGGFVEDTLAAIDYFSGIDGIDDVILAGFCGGAVTSLLTAPRRIGRVKGLALAGPTALLHGSDDTSRPPITGESARQLRIGYLRKVMNPEAWIRLLTLKTDVPQLVKSFVKPLIGNRRKRSVDEILKTVPNFNADFAAAYFDVTQKSLPLLFVFGDRAAERSEFEEIFFPFVASSQKNHRAAYEYQVVADGDHNFVLPEAQETVLDILSDWICKNG